MLLSRAYWQALMLFSWDEQEGRKQSQPCGSIWLLQSEKALNLMIVKITLSGHIFPLGILLLLSVRKDKMQVVSMRNLLFYLFLSLFMVAVSTKM